MLFYATVQFLRLRASRVLFGHQRSLFQINFAAKTMSSRRGALIVLEGCDRCGKSTQANLLVENLKRLEHKVELIRFPDRMTKVGTLISSYLKNEEHLEDHVVHLLFSANRWELRDKMVDLLSNNTTLIVDRYSFSGVAFSAAKPGMDMEWCKQPEIGLPAPDMVLYLDLSTDVAVTRGQFGNERYENHATQLQVRGVYKKLMESYWKVIDANKDVDTLQTELLDNAKNIINTVGNSPLKLLWKDS